MPASQHRLNQGLRALYVLALALVFAGVYPPSLRAQIQQPSPDLKRLQAEAQELYQQRHYRAALEASERVLAQTRREYGVESEQVAIQSYGLGLVAEEAGQLDIAVRAFRENVRIGEKVYGKDSAGVTQGMEKLGVVLTKAGRPADADFILRRVLAIRSALVGPNHSYLASTHAGLGAVALARGDITSALSSYRQAVGLLTAKRENQTLARQVQDLVIRQQGSAFDGLVEAAWRESSRQPRNRPGLTDESFAASQRAWTTAAGSALARMTARLGTADTPLGRRIRRQQQATERVIALHEEDKRELARWSEVQRSDAAFSALLAQFRQASLNRSRDQAPVVKRQTELVAALQAHLAECPPGQRKSGCANAEAERTKITDELGRLSKQASQGGGDLMGIHAQMTAAEKRLPGYDAFTAARKQRIDESTQLEQVASAETKAIAKLFPGYRALTDPEPLSVRAVQGLLGADEALVTLLVGRERSFVWAITREKVQWGRVESGAGDLRDAVSALREGLDPLEGQDDATGARMPRPFILGRAHALYAEVLGPVATTIAGKRHLIVVPTGPLTSLPFHVLLTAPPAPDADQRKALREAPWLIRRHAVSVLPSVPSLAALRRVKQPLSAAEPFLGIGDPALTGRPSAAGTARNALQPSANYRNGAPDLRALRGLVPLPETAAELKAIAEALKSPFDRLLLRNDATETRVRQTDLSRYRVVHFATHGLVAGELSGLAEPALVLTPPIRPSAGDDGLLTASEVATLRLNAEWVVLSACNTASGSDAGAEALSGLARAFFFAGARALLVSHWAVNSEATVWLTTQTFAALAKEPGIGRAEAFRRTMLAMIDAGLVPSAWAPFVIVGEGAGGR